MTGLRRGMPRAIPLTANDANNDRLTYSLEAVVGGETAHADLFQIDRMTGQVTVGLGQKVNPTSDSADEVPSHWGRVIASR